MPAGDKPSHAACLQRDRIFQATLFFLLPDFDAVRKEGRVGIPCIVEDGKIFLKWKDFFEAKGFKTEAAPAACGLSGKCC